MRRAVLAIASGSAVGQVLAILAAPILARLFSPEEFGDFAAVNALAVTLGTVAALKLDSAIPLPADNREAQIIVRTALFASVCVSSVLTAVAASASFLFEGAIAKGAGDVLELLWVAPVIAGAIGCVTVLNQWAIRHARFGAIGRRNAFNAAVMILVQIAAGYLGLGAFGLALGLLGGQLAACFALLLGSGLNWEARSLRTLHSESREVFVRYKKFIFELVPANVLNSLGVYAPAWLILALYGSFEGGLFAMAQRILALPVALLGRSIAQVYLGELARTRRTSPAEMLPLFHSTSRKLIGVSLVVAICIALFSVPAFRLVLGDEWSESGVVAVALAPFIAGQLVASPLSQTLIVLEKTRAQLSLDIMRLALVTSIFVGCSFAGMPLIGAITLFSIVSALYYAVVWLTCRRALISARW